MTLKQGYIYRSRKGDEYIVVNNPHGQRGADHFPFLGLVKNDYPTLAKAKKAGGNLHGDFFFYREEGQWSVDDVEKPDDLIECVGAAPGHITKPNALKARRKLGI